MTSGNSKKGPLIEILPRVQEYSADLVLDRLLSYFSKSNLQLYPHQEESILELNLGNNVILNTPTGSGKSLVATALHFISMAQGSRSFYTSPIKALVNEKFFQLVREFGAESVGLMTGDGSVNSKAPIICCTAEILSQLALREGDRAAVHDVIMDEFHYFGDRERGMAWQVPLLALPQARFLLMSATLGDVSMFSEQLTRLNGRATQVIKSVDRPVPLSFEYRQTPLHESVQDLLGRQLAPVYIVCFTQREAVEQAQSLLSIDFCTKDEKAALAESLKGVSFRSPFGPTMQRLLRHGIGLHHAGLLPRYRLLNERLCQQGKLKLICGTDTLGVGINMPLRTVLFTKLCKYDGEKTSILKVRDFHQIAGRAGRKGYDTAGTVACQAPEHVIENLKMEQKIAADPKKAKKWVKAKPPEKGYVAWDAQTFERLQRAEPERLESRFEMTTSVLLSVLQRTLVDKNVDVRREIQRLINQSFETPSRKKHHRDLGWQIFRALLDRGLVTLAREKPKVRVSIDLQEDFTLHHAMMLYFVDAIAGLDILSPNWALDVLSLAEAVCENPEPILMRQRDKAKSQKLAEMKAAGIEYEQRMEELEKVDHPKPLLEYIAPTVELFAERHPWIRATDVAPKSIAREMMEGFLTFSGFVQEYDLERSEGVLLRYLTDVYKLLTQSVPQSVRTEGLDESLGEIETYLRQTIRSTDSSLIDEWTRLQAGGDAAAGVLDESSAVRQMTDELALKAEAMRSLERSVATEAFLLIRELISHRWQEAAARILAWSGHVATDSAQSDQRFGMAWSASRLESKWREYEADSESGRGRRARLDPAARNKRNLHWTALEGGWRQLDLAICDFDDLNDWSLRVRANHSGIIEFLDIGPVVGGNP